MAGHSKFKNIQHRKGAQDKKRAKIFTKLIREIITAVKAGQPDINSNPRLRTVLSTARIHNLPKDRIERAIHQASNQDGDSNYDEIRYEGYAQAGVAVIVEALTDNRNRTAAEVRSTFNKNGGTLGETGSVSFMFDHVGVIEYPAKNIPAESILEYAIEINAKDVESDEEVHYVYTQIEEFSIIRDKLYTKYGDPINAHLIWKPQNLVIINDLEKAEKLQKLIDILEDNDDVQHVFANYELSDELYKKLMEE